MASNSKYSSNDYDNNSERDRRAQLSLPYVLSHFDRLLKENFTKKIAENEAQAEEIKQQNVAVLRHVAKFTQRVRSLKGQHADDLKKVQDLLRDEIKKHKEEQVERSRYVGQRSRVVPKLTVRRIKAQHEDQYKKHSDYLVNIRNFLDTTAAAHGFNIPDEDFIAALKTFTGRIATTQHQSVEDKIRQLKDVQKVNENTIKGSLRKLYESCGSDFNENFEVSASVATISEIASHMVLELKQIKQDNQVIANKVDALISNFAPGDTIFQHDNMHFKLERLRMAITTYARDQVQHEIKQAHSSLSEVVQEGSQSLGIARTLDNGDTIHMIQNFVHPAVASYKDNKKNNTELLQNLRQTAIAQGVALSDQSAESLQACLPEYIVQVGEQLSTLRKEKEQLQTTNSGHTNLIGRLRRRIETSWYDFTGALPEAGEGESLDELLDRCITVVSPQIQQLNAVKSHVDSLVSRFGPDFDNGSTSDKVKLCVDHIVELNTSPTQAQNQLTEGMDAVQNVADRAIEPQGYQLPAGPGQPPERRLKRFVNATQERLQAWKTNTNIAGTLKQNLGQTQASAQGLKGLEQTEHAINELVQCNAKAMAYVKEKLQLPPGTMASISPLSIDTSRRTRAQTLEWLDKFKDDFEDMVKESLAWSAKKKETELLQTLAPMVRNLAYTIGRSFRDMDREASDSDGHQLYVHTGESEELLISNIRRMQDYVKPVTDDLQAAMKNLRERTRDMVSDIQAVKQQRQVLLENVEDYQQKISRLAEMHIKQNAQLSRQKKMLVQSRNLWR